jgi:hypothetical protein
MFIYRLAITPCDVTKCDKNYFLYFLSIVYRTRPNNFKYLRGSGNLPEPLGPNGIQEVDRPIISASHSVIFITSSKGPSQNGPMRSMQLVQQYDNADQADELSALLENQIGKTWRM